MTVYGQQLSEKVNKSIERLKAFEPAEGYHLSFSAVEPDAGPVRRPKEFCKR